MKRFIYFCLTLLIMISIISCNSTKNTSDTSNLEVGYEVGNLAFDIEVENIDGELVKLSDFKGKPVYILAWASS